MPKILVVYDEESIRFSFKRALTDAGYEVIVAGHSIEARAVLSANEFDVAVIDRILPDGQNGLDLVKHIKKAQPFCETILVSAYPSFKSANETLKYETFACLNKQVKREERCRVVMNLCANACHAMIQSKDVFGVSLDGPEAKTELDPGHYIKLTVSDTGHGMDKKTKEHILQSLLYHQG